MPKRPWNEPAPVDIRFEDHGSIWLIRHLTMHGRDWCYDHLPADCPMLGEAYACEARFIRDVIGGSISDGLSVECC